MKSGRAAARGLPPGSSIRPPIAPHCGCAPRAPHFSRPATISAFDLETFRAQKIDVPMLAGCITWMECKVIPDDSQRHDLIIGEVVAAYADSRVYSHNRWHFGDDPDLRTCHYVAGGTFFATGDAFEVAPVAAFAQ
ncbi:flavin reductase (DIM6/NTAB) family NADH-FMN oxidoreductase RutF [Paraburkholderia sp. JPY162]|uniref:Flavin reductase (DIM6/NTAB) family NADH-FMN oxidoreductase RutF n=1 Tax=Paraburkholderia youngii TaxID=2782701 RepID=A0A7W8NZA0_9BURK|nr:flavin reductase (DIM6/NTAB) family NADH-FMN oxidoreductase RutF [Paraburkholderia youngii]